MKRVIIVLFILAVFTSCKDSKNEKDKVDSFYTELSFMGDGDILQLPLFKPLRLNFQYKLKNDKWLLGYSGEFQIKLDIAGENIDSIGFEKLYLYGKLSSKEYFDSFAAKESKFVYARKDGAILGKKKMSNRKDLLLLNPIDSTKLNYEVPARWFVIDTAFNTEVFFDKEAYKKYLKAKGISGELHHPDVYFKEYFETGVLPWFPDSIKEKVRKK